MLSNRIWIMPTADRASRPGTATIYYRCGTQRGKPAREVSATLTEVEFNQLTAEFIQAEVGVYSAAVARKQKNSARNLRKYFDSPDIATIERHGADISSDVISSLLH
ncbi:MAG: hypothetical protein JWR36_1598 [Glaciihabitans sp.]|jgi:hypothetical protein|nr:hypothetical protein [Glaciihabitans sp.]